MSLSLQRLASQVLYGDEIGSRTIDTRIRLLEWGDSENLILDVGGRWDKIDRCWVDDGEHAIEWRVHPGQYEVAYLFADWFAAYAAGIPAGEREGALRDMYAILIEGGRGAGKSDFGVRAIAMIAAGMSERIVWGISPAQEETEELRMVIDGLIPCSERFPSADSWCVWLESKQTFFFWNGSMIRLLSGYKPSALKRGRVDAWLMNEAQRFSKRAYMMARPRLADTSGLGLMAANPPDTPAGEWVTEFRDGIRAGKILDIKVIKMDNELNPTLDWRSLELLKGSFGTDDYLREVMGEHIPVGSRVFYSWSDALNIRPIPDVGDVTREVTKKLFGRSFSTVAGLDFQLAPYMSAEFCRFFRDPDDPDGSLLWFFDSVQIRGNEHDLTEAMVSKGYDPDDTAIVADASGEWQDAERTKGGGSFDMLRRDGWRWIFRPDHRMRKNPPVIERIQAANARMCNAAGGRKLFADPACHYSNVAMRKWQNKHGKPDRFSEFSHVGDARSYVVWRAYPRRVTRAGFKFKKIARNKTAREKDLDVL